jgi:hypothetical protein
MTKSTNDHDPDYTKIGDLQYHHYTVEIPEDATNFNLTVSGDDTCDIYIYLKKNAFAFDGEADHQLEQSGINHIFSLPDISTGTWYIGIKCATTVEAEKQSWGYRYSGQLEVLNGIGYKITASWETPSNISMPFTSSPDKYELHQNYPNPFNPITMIGYQLMLDSAVELSIYNLLGEKITTLVNERQLAGYHQVEWNASGLASGVYLYKISTSNFVKVKKMVLTR